MTVGKMISEAEALAQLQQEINRSSAFKPPPRADVNLFKFVETHEVETYSHQGWVVVSVHDYDFPQAYTEYVTVPPTYHGGAPQTQQVQRYTPMRQQRVLIMCSADSELAAAVHDRDYYRDQWIKTNNELLEIKQAAQEVVTHVKEQGEKT